jgi:hypothetical protein
MALRANKFLKYFAIVLFMLEFLAPAFPLEASTAVDGFDKTFQVSSSSRTGIFLTLFAEQLNENETGRENYKSLSPFIDSCFTFSNPHHSYIIRVGPTQIENNTHYFHSQPLFRLHCTYLI